MLWKTNRSDSAHLPSCWRWWLFWWRIFWQIRLKDLRIRRSNVHFDFGDGGLGDIFSQFSVVQLAVLKWSFAWAWCWTSNIKFEDAVFGVEKKISFIVDVECEHCHGDGAEPGFGMKTCPTCKGAGQQLNDEFAGLGKFSKVVCETCHGKGKRPSERMSGLSRRGCHLISTESGYHY